MLDGDSLPRSSSATDNFKYLSAPFRLFLAYCFALLCSHPLHFHFLTPFALFCSYICASLFSPFCASLFSPFALPCSASDLTWRAHMMHELDTYGSHSDFAFHRAPPGPPVVNAFLVVQEYPSPHNKGYQHNLTTLFHHNFSYSLLIT